MLYILGNYYCEDLFVEGKIRLERYRLPHFIIKRTGTIIEAKSVSKNSYFLDSLHLKQKHVSIALCNLGHLEKKMKYTDLYGNYYSDEVLEKKWRTYRHWEPYTKAQYQSLKTLLKGFDIKSNMINKNLIVDPYEKKENGVYFRCNYDEDYLDITPAFNMKFYE